VDSCVSNLAGMKEGGERGEKEGEQREYFRGDYSESQKK